MNIIGATYFALIGALILVSVLFLAYVIYKAATSRDAEDKPE